MQGRDLLARVRFRHLRMVEVLACSGSLRAAAGELHLTQPALSKALGELEKAFGFALFTRSVRGLKPTARGEVVLRGAAVLLAELRHLHAEAESAERGPAARLRLGAPPFLALGFVPAALSRLLGAVPVVAVELHENRVPQLFDALLAGDLDALITSYSADVMRKAGSAALRYEKLRDQQFALVAPAAHPLARARRVAWPALADARWILPDANSLLRQTVDASFVRAGIVPPAPLVESANPVTNMRLVAQGIGIAVVPAELARESRGAALLVQVPVQPALPTVPVALVYRASSAAHPRLTRLREALQLAQR